MNQSDTESEPSRREVWKMFDRIAHRYDLLNRLLSLGRDVSWRRRMARHLPEKDSLRLLDLATGTADQIIFLRKKDARIREAVGVDMSEQMLVHGRVKIEALGWDDVVELRSGNAEAVPVEDATFDVCTISFGIRNVEEVSQGLAEMYRSLRPGGRALILEFSLPRNRLMRGLYLFYFRHVLPRVGGWISGDSYAYSYLNQTVETFPYGEEFAGLMSGVGFESVSVHPLTFGIASIYRGDRPEDS